MVGGGFTTLGGADEDDEDEEDDDDGKGDAAGPDPKGEDEGGPLKNGETVFPPRGDEGGAATGLKGEEAGGGWNPIKGDGEYPEGG